MSSTPPVRKPGLERALGPFMATAIVVGTVIGSGVFKKPATVALNVPQFGLAASVVVLRSEMVHIPPAGRGPDRVADFVTGEGGSGS